MARPVKTDADKQLTKKQVMEVLNQAEIWDVAEFANSYRNFNGGYFTPDLINRRMADITMNPLEAETSSIESMLKNPKGNEKNLRDVGTSQELQSMLYKRLIRFYTDMLSYDYTYTCRNIESDSNFSKADFLKDEAVLVDFMEKLNPKNTFPPIMRQMLRNEAVYTVLRDEGEAFTFQELPMQHCKITSRWDFGLLFDFNMQWFVSNYGVDINMYPKVFKQMFNRVFNTGHKTNYKPSSAVDKRDDTFVYWSQTSPEDGFWCFKTNEEIITQVPYFSPLFPDLSNQALIRKLQTSRYMIESHKLLISTIGFNKDEKAGNVKNALNISPAIAGQFSAMVRQALLKEIQFAMIPSSDIVPVEFQVSDKNISSEHTKMVADSSGSSSNVMYTSEKKIQYEAQTALSIDKNFAMSFYRNFENFVNYHINTRTSKYKFNVKFEGTNFPDDRKARREEALSYAELGIVMYQKLASAIGMTPNEFEQHMQMSMAKKIDKNLIALSNVFNQGGEGVGAIPKKKPKAKGTTSKGGRPAVSSSSNDSTASSQDRGQ